MPGALNAFPVIHRCRGLVAGGFRPAGWLVFEHLRCRCAVGNDLRGRSDEESHSAADSVADACHQPWLSAAVHVATVTARGALLVARFSRVNRGEALTAAGALGGQTRWQVRSC